MASYYIDTLSFSTATAVYTDIGLSTHAPDGYYSFSGSYRQQSGGVLITPLTTCTVTPPIVANDDSYSAIVTQGINAYNILSNDTLGGGAATTSNVVITQMSTTNPSVNINTSTGAVVVATGTTVGSYTIVYQICEIGNLTNCDTANVSISITPLVNEYCMNFDTDCELACETVNCVQYTISTSSSSVQSFEYIDCESSTVTFNIGGSGYEQYTFCAIFGSVIMYGPELSLTYDGPC